MICFKENIKIWFTFTMANNEKTCPICGMKDTIPAHNQYFYSEHYPKKIRRKRRNSL
jgi:hypothetical protein